MPGQLSRFYHSQALRFVFVGGLNTLVGYGVFALTVYVTDIPVGIANVIGYAVALVFAYFLYKNFVFNYNAKKSNTIKYIISFLFSFLSNQIVLLFLVNYKHVNPYISQIFSMTVYTIIFYILNKNFVFRSN